MALAYVCPMTRKPLSETEYGLQCDDGKVYPFLTANGQRIPDFLSLADVGAAGQRSLGEYNRSDSTDVYRNFLDWMFGTFGEEEVAFRSTQVARMKLKPGSKVLITGCGLGDDIPLILDVIGPAGVLYASDLAAEMSAHASRYARLDRKVFFSVCDANSLPFLDDYFDAAFHFGGINLFDDIKGAISEMNRVVRPGGRVVFGDEGVAPWLKQTEYGRIAITNNHLWKLEPPLHLLPETAVDVEATWVLGNCFYMISFEVSASGPHMNIDLIHKGRRGGSMRTRYFGQLEGVSQQSKQFVLEDAHRRGISVFAWLEEMIAEKRGGR
jgi:ubiquinone/menaquinone biosynthesis C-methylase UbiE